MTGVKNRTKGKRLKTIQEIQDLSAERKAVLTKRWGVKPAAILESQSIRNVQKMLDNGEIHRLVKIDHSKK